MWSWRGQPRPLKGNQINSVLAAFATLLVAAIGVAAIVYAEVDDSPGGQLFGVLFVIGAIWLGWKTVSTSQRNK